MCYNILNFKGNVVKRLSVQPVKTAEMLINDNAARMKEFDEYINARFGDAVPNPILGPEYK